MRASKSDDLTRTIVPIVFRAMGNISLLSTQKLNLDKSLVPLQTGNHFALQRKILASCIALFVAPDAVRLLSEFGKSQNPAHPLHFYEEVD